MELHTSVFSWNLVLRYFHGTWYFGIFMELDTSVFSWNLIARYFFEVLSRKLKFHLNPTIITGTLHEDKCIFVIISRSFQTEVVEKIKTRILCSINSVLINRAVYEIMWENIVQLGRPRVTI